MRLAFVADPRAEHARQWLQYCASAGDDVLLLGTFPGPPIPGVQTEYLPVVFNLGATLIKGTGGVTAGRRASAIRFVFRAGLSGAAYPIWQQLRAIDAFRQARQARTALEAFRPDVIHTLRIQNEGYVGGLAAQRPLIVGAWGSDFVLMARRYPVHRVLTRRLMRRADAFTADCRRDIRLAHEHGLAPGAPTQCFPGNGGINRGVFGPPAEGLGRRERLILYARGLPPYARMDSLLRAFRMVLGEERGAPARLLLLAPSAQVPTLERICWRHGLTDAQVTVQPSVPRDGLVRLLQTAAVSVSNLPNDGVPVSMLEAMACGAFPVMSGLESIREWITHGANGLLFDPDDPEDLAACLREALNNDRLRRDAQQVNSQLISERADFETVMPRVRQFYAEVASG